MASYYHQYNDRGDHVNRVEIIDSAQSTPIKITTSTGDPIHLRHAGDKNDRKIIKGKELQFSFYCLPGDVDKYDEIFESDYKDYKVRFYKDSQLKFEGWLTPENLSREFFKDKYIINLSATDGLAKLKNVEFLDTGNSIIEGKLSLLEVIKYALAKLELELDFRIQLGTYESALMASTECALKEMSVETRRFVIGNKPMFCSQVIEACLKTFSCTLKQQDGYYQITNKHEGNSYQFVFDWSSLTQQSRTATDKIVDLSGYFYENAELNKISPLREFGIIFRNRDLGEDATGADLTDWDNDWTITFDNYWVDNGVVQLSSGVNYPGDYIELKDDFNVPHVPPFNSTHYIIVTFDYYIETITPTRPNPNISISVKRPDGEYSDPLFIYPQLDKWVHFDSKSHPRLRVLSSGDHNIRFTFDHTEDSGPGNFYFFLKNINISAADCPGGDPDIDTQVSQDEYYKQTAGKNMELLEEEAKFADGDIATETGALLHNGSTLTTIWNSYGNTEGIKILDIWARNELNNRYSYKNYLKIIVHDKESTIDMDKILSIEGRYYEFISYQRNQKKCIVTGDLEELLLTHQSYSVINSYALESSEGDSTSSSSAGVSSIDVHNYLIGLQGGTDDEYYHLTASEHLELHAWMDNVVLSDAGGIDMDDVLLVDTIQEHTTDAGVTIEGIKLEDSTIITAAANLVFQDGSTGPHNLSDLVGGAGYWDRTGTTLSPTNAGDDIEIDGGVLKVNTINEYDAGVGVIVEGIKFENSEALFPVSTGKIKFGDGDTYIYESNDDILRFYVGGTERLRLDSNYAWFQNKGLLTTNIPYAFAMRIDDAVLYLQANVYSDTAPHGNTWNYYRSGGNYGSQSVTPADSNILMFRNYVYDGGAYLENARYVIDVSGTPASGSASGRFRWYVREATGSLTERMTLQPDGELEINVIGEKTGAAGVTIDGLLLRDGSIGTSSNYQLYAYLTGINLQAEANNINCYTTIYSNSAGHTNQDYVRHYGGTIASPAAAPTDAVLRNIRGYAYDGGAVREITRYTIKVDGAVASNNVAGEHLWYLRPSGAAAALATVMHLDQNGLKIDTIIEYTGYAGVTIESVKIEDGTLYTALTDMTFQDATGGPYTLAQLAAGGVPDAHAASHQNGGGDEISVTGLAGLLQDAQNPVSHAANHQNGGGDEISVTGLAGLLQDAQNPVSHAANHQNGGGDEISIAGLSGLLADGQTPLSHIHGNITNAGAIGSTANLPIITTTSGVLTVGSFGTGANTFCQGNDARLSDARTPTAHNTTHQNGGGDEISVAGLSGLLADGQTPLAHNHAWSDITSGVPTTLSGYGISDTMANFNTACSNGTFAYSGGAFHDGFSDFVGNEHINHTSVSMGTAATSGLNGGGTIASTRALVLAVNRLTAVTTLQSTDYFPFYDNSGSGTRRISYANLLNELNGDLSVGGGIDMTNGANNRVCTAVDIDTINGEANLTFDGTLLTIATGGITIHGTYVQYNTTDVDERLTMAASVDEYAAIYNWDEGDSAYKYLRLGSNVVNQGITIDGATGNVGLCIAPPAGTYYRVNIGGTTSIYGTEEGALDLSASNAHATGSSRFLLAVNDETEFTVLQLDFGGDGLFKQGLDDIIWGWDSSANMGIGTTDTESTAQLYCATNKVSGYAAHFFNDGNGANRYGIKISCGTDDQSGTVNYFLRGYAGNKTTEEGGLRNSSGTFAVYQGSDRRRKTNIVDTEIDAAGILSSLKVRDYNRIGSKGKLSNKQTGWIAQEVAEIYPAMHGYSKDTDLHSVTPTELIPVLNRGWQLHEEKIETHEQKIQRLERRIKILETELKKS